MEVKGKIIAAPSASDPCACVFTTENPIFPGGSFNCPSREAAEGSPLLESLFAFPWIRQVWVEENRLTIEKDSTEPWTLLGKKVGDVLRTHFNSGRPFVLPAEKPAAPLMDRIVKILAEEINPGLAGHGGRAEVVGVDGGRVSLRLSGGCQGCGAAQMTLRQGIEKVLKSIIPEITEVVDVTDHASGKNPFYKSPSGENPSA